MSKEASYQIDCACAMNLYQNFGRAMAQPARPVPPDLTCMYSVYAMYVLVTVVSNHTVCKQLCDGVWYTSSPICYGVWTVVLGQQKL